MVTKQQQQQESNFAASLGRSQSENPVITNIERHNWQSQTLNYRAFQVSTKYTDSV